MFEALLGCGVLVGLIVLRIPIAFAMALVGVTGFALLRGWQPAWSLTGQVLMDTTLSYTLSVIPLFIVMGNVLAASGVAQGLYAGANRLLGQFKGGLALASVLSCGLFSAVCGSSLATAATMSKVAIPPMKQYGYDAGFATGTVAAGGTLGILIPPSVILIIYGLLTEADIAKLFIAGIVPGILGVVLYLIAVKLVVWFKPELAPGKQHSSPLQSDEVISIVSVLALFLVIILGIYAGLFTPTEAAGIGAAVSILIAFGLRRITWKQLLATLLESLRTTAMIFAVIIGAELFTTFINFAGLPEVLADLVLGQQWSNWQVMLMIVLVYLLLGCMLESLSIVLLTVPIFYPLMYEMSFQSAWLTDPELILIWFAIIVVVLTEISLITPPIGMNVFIIKGVVKDVPIQQIYRGVFPFWIADMIRLALLLCFPIISLGVLSLLA